MRADLADGPFDLGEVEDFGRDATMIRRAIDADPTLWNESKFGLVSLLVGRVLDLDRTALRLVYAVTDYASSLASGLRHGEFSEVVPGMSHSFWLNATVVTDDDALVLSRRSARLAGGRSGRHISVNEGMRSSDVDDLGRPDPDAALVRGIAEEPGIAVPADRVLQRSGRAAGGPVAGP